MLTLAETDLPVWLAVLLAAALAAAAMVHWKHLDRPEVPESRRRIRRLSILLALVLLPGLVWCSSMLDHRESPAAYVGGWLACMALLALVVLTAVADGLNSMWIHHRDLQRHRRRFDEASGSANPDGADR